MYTRAKRGLSLVELKPVILPRPDSTNHHTVRAKLSLHFEFGLRWDRKCLDHTQLRAKDVFKLNVSSCQNSASLFQAMFRSCRRPSHHACNKDVQGGSLPCKCFISQQIQDTSLFQLMQWIEQLSTSWRTFIVSSNSFLQHLSRFSPQQYGCVMSLSINVYGRTCPSAL